VPLAHLRAHVATLRAFSYPAYRRIWLGAFVSNVGTWVQNIALGVWVTQTTGKAGWTGTIAALSYLPADLLGPLSGALADRWDRRRLVAGLILIQTLSAAGLAVLGLSGHLSLGAIAGLVLAGGCASAAAAPAFNALLSEIVEPQDLLSAVSLNSAQFNLARTVGPMVAAFVLTLGGVGAAFVANAVLTLAVVAAVAFVRGLPPRGPAPTESLLRGIAEGFRVARTDPGIRLALPLVVAMSVLITSFTAVSSGSSLSSTTRFMRSRSLNTPRSCSPSSTRMAPTWISAIRRTTPATVSFSPTWNSSRFCRISRTPDIRFPPRQS